MVETYSTWRKGITEIEVCNCINKEFGLSLYLTVNEAEINAIAGYKKLFKITIEEVKE